MKTCSELFLELLEKKNQPTEHSGTSRLLHKGKLAVSQKLIEEAAEIWMAVRFEEKADIALEISQYWYYLMVYSISEGIFSGDVLNILTQVESDSWKIKVHEKPNKELIHTSVSLITGNLKHEESVGMIQYLFRLTEQIAHENEVKKESIFNQL